MQIFVSDVNDFLTIRGCLIVLIFILTARFKALPDAADSRFLVFLTPFWALVNGQVSTKNQNLMHSGIKLDILETLPKFNWTQKTFPTTIFQLS